MPSWEKKPTSGGQRNSLLFRVEKKKNCDDPGPTSSSSVSQCSQGNGHSKRTTNKGKRIVVPAFKKLQRQGETPPDETNGGKETKDVGGLEKSSIEKL